MEINLPIILVSLALSLLVFYLIIRVAVYGAVSDLKKDLKTLLYARFTPDEIAKAEKLVALIELDKQFKEGGMDQEAYKQKRKALAA
jgi:hypothetical protein